MEQTKKPVAPPHPESLDTKDVKNTSREIPLERFADNKFKHVCPRCGFPFNE